MTQETNPKLKAVVLEAVVFDYSVWEELLTLLEDLEDAEEIRRLRESGEESIPWEQAKAELRSEGIDV